MFRQRASRFSTRAQIRKCIRLRFLFQCQRLPFLLTQLDLPARAFKLFLFQTSQSFSFLGSLTLILLRLFFAFGIRHQFDGALRARRAVLLLRFGFIENAPAKLRERTILCTATHTTSHDSCQSNAQHAHDASRTSRARNKRDNRATSRTRVLTRIAASAIAPIAIARLPRTRDAHTRRARAQNESTHNQPLTFKCCCTSYARTACPRFKNSNTAIFSSGVKSLACMDACKDESVAVLI
jgi:hypothetical protein